MHEGVRTEPLGSYVVYAEESPWFGEQLGVNPPFDTWRNRWLLLFCAQLHGELDVVPARQVGHVQFCWYPHQPDAEAKLCS